MLTENFQISKSIVLIFLFFSIAVNAQKKLIVISANYCNGEQLFFSFQDYFGDHVVSNHIKVTSEWRVIKSDDPILIVFSRDWKLYPVLALPGDTISAECHKADGIKFFGNRKSLDLNALSYLEQKIGFLIPSLVGMEITNQLDFNYLDKSFDSLHAERKRFLDSLYQNRATEMSLYYEFLNMLKNQQMDEYLRPFTVQNEDFLIKTIPPEYVKKCENFKDAIDNDMIYDRFYRSFLIDFTDFILKDTLPSKRSQFMRYQVALKYFGGASQEFLLFNLLKKDRSFMESSLGKGLPKALQNKRHIKYIDSLAQMRDKLNTDREILTTRITKANNSSVYFTDFLKTYKGKPVYIDFWASWCAPCITEMPSLKLLEERYKGQISFASISIDDERAKWLKAVKKYSLESTHQWLISKDSVLAKYLGLQSIPRFILLDKDGMVISLDAPRPSNESDLAHLFERVLFRTNE